MGDLSVFMEMYDEEWVLLALSSGIWKESLTNAAIFGIFMFYEDL